MPRHLRFDPRVRPSTRLRRRTVLGGALLVLTATVAATPATAAPVTVNLRIEGPASTIYEGPVSTDTRTIDLGDGGGSRTCDGTNNGAHPTAGPTRGAAVAAAAAGPGGFAFSGTYFASFQDIGFTTIAGQNVAFDPATSAFLGEYRNWAGSMVGSCQEQIASGDDVLYAYGVFGSPLLRLSGPATVLIGQPVTLKVTDGGAADVPVPGVSVGGQSTAADGSASIVLTAAGPQSFKASKAGAIRSNRISVCATTGSDGACGTSLLTPCAVSAGASPCNAPDRVAPRSALFGIKDGHVFARGRGPRTLRARIARDPSGLLIVKLRLSRNDHGRCTYFSGRSERFVRGRAIDGTRCGAEHAYWFGVGADADVDYLLPGRLPRGRYVLDVNAIDKAYNRDDTRQRGRNRIVFHVR